MAGSRLCSHSFCAFLHVVVSLCNGGVGLVASWRADAFVLVIDFGRRLQSFLQSKGSEERSGSPKLIDVPHLFGNVYPSVFAELLSNDLFGINQGDDSGSRCPFVRLYCRRQWLRHVGQYAVPLLRYFFFI